MLFMPQRASSALAVREGSGVDWTFACSLCFGRAMSSKFERVLNEVVYSGPCKTGLRLSMLCCIVNAIMERAWFWKRTRRR
jgi:hypothetical protein